MIEWPEGAELAIGLWFDRKDAPSALLAVGGVLEAEGGRYTGALRTAPAGTSFTWVNRFEDKDTKYFEDRTPEQIRSALGDGTAYRVTMLSLPWPPGTATRLRGRREPSTPVGSCVMCPGSPPVGGHVGLIRSIAPAGAIEIEFRRA